MLYVDRSDSCVENRLLVGKGWKQGDRNKVKDDGSQPKMVRTDFGQNIRHLVLDMLSLKYLIDKHRLSGVLHIYESLPLWSLHFTGISVVNIINK